MEHHRAALLFDQAVERSVELLVFEVLVCGVPARDPYCRFERAAIALVIEFPAVQKAVVSNLQQPGGEFAASAVARGCEVGFDEGLLGEVVGELPIAAKPQQEQSQLPLGLFNIGDELLARHRPALFAAPASDKVAYQRGYADGSANCGDKAQEDKALAGCHLNDGKHYTQ